MFIGKKIIRGVKITFRLARCEWWDECIDKWKITAYSRWWKPLQMVHFSDPKEPGIVENLQWLEQQVDRYLKKQQEGATILKRARAWFKGDEKDEN